MPSPRLSPRSLRPFHHHPRLLETLESRLLLTTVTLVQGNNLQTALNNAQPGDTIILTAGATFVGNFTLPNKTTGNATITIESSALVSLPAGVRVGPAQAALMPKILSNASNVPALATQASAHNYTFIGIEFSTTSAAVTIGDLIDLGDGSSAQNSLSQVPTNLVIDRSYIHGFPNVVSEKRGIALNSSFTTIENSYLSDFHSNGQDSQAIAAWNGPGNYTITNNYLEGAGENVLFGGADASIPNLVPSNITITGNYFSKPLSWDPNDPSFAGTTYVVKNILEFKNAENVTVDKNIFENNWVGGQSGFAIVFTTRDQSGTNPWATVANITFTNNIVRHSAAGINYLSSDDDFTSFTTHDITITNNLFYDIGGAEWGGSGIGIQMVKGPNAAVNFNFSHNTLIETDMFLSLDSGQTANTPIISSGFVFQNNIVEHAVYGIHGTAEGEGNAALQAFLPNALFTGNVIIGGSSSLYPAGNSFPATDSAVGFTNEANAQYYLAPTSTFKGKATDSTDPGVNYPFVASLNRANVNPTSGPTVNFTVTFTTPVTGVDAADFALAATGLTGDSIASVTGSGSTYNVLVNTGTGSGTLGLNLVDNDSILNATLAPLAGLGAATGNFTGQTYSVATDTTPPTITAAYVDSTQWTSTYLNDLASTGQGSATLGYKIPTGSSAQLRDLPWANLNQISIQFSENVTVAQAALTLTGLSATYPSSTFAYNSTTHVATWTFSSALPTDHFQIAIPSASVADLAGNALDGEWTDSTSTTSGNGTAGGNFNFHFNLLPGDLDASGAVDINDLATLAAHWQLNATSPAQGDLDGNAFVDINDLAILASNWQAGVNSPGANLTAAQLAPSLAASAITPTPTPTPTTSSPPSTSTSKPITQYPLPITHSPLPTPQSPTSPVIPQIPITHYQLPTPHPALTLHSSSPLHHSFRPAHSTTHLPPKSPKPSLALLDRRA